MKLKPSSDVKWSFRRNTCVIITVCVCWLTTIPQISCWLQIPFPNVICRGNKIKFLWYVLFTDLFEQMKYIWIIGHATNQIMVPGARGSNFESVNTFYGLSSWTLNSTLIQIMAWSRFWLIFMSPFGVTRPQWVNKTITLCELFIQLLRSVNSLMHMCVCKLSDRSSCDGLSAIRIKIQTFSFTEVHVVWKTAAILFLP